MGFDFLKIRYTKTNKNTIKNEKKFKKMEEERPNEMEMAKENHESKKEKIKN